MSTPRFNIAQLRRRKSSIAEEPACIFPIESDVYHDTGPAKFFEQKMSMRSQNAQMSTNEPILDEKLHTNPYHFGGTHFDTKAGRREEEHKELASPVI